MARELRTVPEPSAIWTVWRATKFEQLQRISSAAKQVMSLEKDLLTSGLGVRVYAVEHDGLVIAWGRFVVQHGTAWVDDLFTQPSLRGRGVMTALLNFAERDVMESGVLQTVLVCSEANREFHVRRGYETVAIKLRFLPNPGLLEGWMRTAKTHLGRLMRRA
jgi:GNAT superfamily N-acetyltransferase